MSDALRKTVFEAGYAFTDIVNLCSTFATDLARLFVNQEAREDLESLGLAPQEMDAIALAFLRVEGEGLRAPALRGFDVWADMIAANMDDRGRARTLIAMLRLFVELEPSPPMGYTAEMWAHNIIDFADMLESVLDYEGCHSAHDRTRLFSAFTWLKVNFSDLWH